MNLSENDLEAMVDFENYSAMPEKLTKTIFWILSFPS